MTASFRIQLAPHMPMPPSPKARSSPSTLPEGRVKSLLADLKGKDLEFLALAPVRAGITVQTGASALRLIQNNRNAASLTENLANTPMQIDTAYQDKNRTLARCG